MKICRVIAVLTLVVAGCGDNLRPESTSFNAPAGFSSVGGSQVAHSKSFMLVTSVSTSPQSVAKNRNVKLTSGLGEQ